VQPDPLETRARLATARVLLLFTPDLVRGADPLEVLERALPWVDVVQVRPKGVAAGGGSLAPCTAREAYDWTRRVLALEVVRRARPLVMVDDRVDVAAALWGAGCAGVHVGQDDTPAAVARAFLGDGPLIGVSTHTLDQVAEADDGPADCLGFGPVHATGTKGYARGLGSEACWIAAQGTSKPLFPIGGIDVENAQELARVGRAAVGAAILATGDPAAAARAIRTALEQS
jgi:thiamine-phosphate pyrophosphorylase